MFYALQRKGHPEERRGVAVLDPELADNPAKLFQLLRINRLTLAPLSDAEGLETLNNYLNPDEPGDDLPEADPEENPETTGEDPETTGEDPDTTGETEEPTGADDLEYTPEPADDLETEETPAADAKPKRNRKK